MQGIDPKLLERARVVARILIEQSKDTAPIDLLKNGGKHKGVLSTSDKQMIAIGSFELEGKRFYIGLPMPT